MLSITMSWTASQTSETLLMRLGNINKILIVYNEMCQMQSSIDQFSEPVQNVTKL